MDRGSSPDAFWNADLEEIARRGLRRRMPEVEGMPGRSIVVDGREALNFSSNNYLGMAAHPWVIDAAVEHARRFGAGSTASRLIAGSGEAFRELEEFIARWKGTEAALVFGSGYQANVGVLTSLADEDDLVVSDALNHASIIDGCRLSRAAVRVYPHLDLNRLEDMLRSSGYRRKFVVTESVFSMDGDRAALRDLSELCDRHAAILMVDEAHAAGVLGPQGQGLAAALGVTPHIQMGTLGKAVGVSGAYIAGSRLLIELLVNRARSLIYTTALPPAVIGAALEALRIIASDEGAARRGKLSENSRLFHTLLARRFGRSAEPGHIVPFHAGGSDRALRVSRRCLDAGIFAHAIRYPTVSEGTARLRFTLMSDHTPEDVERAVSALAAASDEESRGRESSPTG